MVRDVWHSVLIEGSHLERWQVKIIRLRQYLRGWAKNVSGAYEKEKKTLLNKLDELDKKAENSLLDETELNLKHVLNERLAELLREEELKWYQRAKTKHLLEGVLIQNIIICWLTIDIEKLVFSSWRMVTL
jgi:hypothetical protein